ncbi:hypothetical protein L9F63_027391, partial [Diploptera punctata]
KVQANNALPHVRTSHSPVFFSFSIIYHDSFRNKIIKQILITYAIHMSRNNKYTHYYFLYQEIINHV